MMPRRSAKCAQEYYDDNHERYYEERAAAFKELIEGCIQSYLDSANTEDGSLSTADFFDDTDVEFEFPEIGDWLASEFEGMIGDYEDQRYDEMRDRQMMGDD